MVDIVYIEKFHDMNTYIPINNEVYQNMNNHINHISEEEAKAAEAMKKNKECVFAISLTIEIPYVNSNL